jgi:hypothetical protein
MLMSIWSADGKRIAAESEQPVAPELPLAKLPAQSLVILSTVQPERLADLAADRSIAA